MPEKSLEELVRWTKAYKGNPSPSGLVQNLRNLPDPRETWKWLQDLLLDDKNTTADISNLLHSDKPWSDIYGSPATIRTHLQIIRLRFLGVKFDRSNGYARKDYTPPPPPARPVVKPAAPLPTDSPVKLEAKIRMLLDLGLSKETLIKVLTEIT